jgi:hypothetical protein
MWKPPAKGGIMPIRRLLVLAIGVALAIAALAPASALAKAGGTDRPVKGTMSGVETEHLATLSAAAEETGVATHLGRFSLHAETVITGFTPPNIFEFSGTLNMVAANGDRLVGTLTGTSTATGPGPIGNFTGHTATIDVTITGGTGRFADASGMLTDTQVATVISREDGTTYGHLEDTFTGEISY